MYQVGAPGAGSCYFQGLKFWSPVLLSLFSCAADSAPIDTAPRGPTIQVAPDALTMRAAVGDEAVETVTITNVGDAALEIYDARLADGADYAAFAPGSIGRLVLGAGDSTTLEVMFTPEAATLYDGVLIVTSNDPETPEAEVTLEGVGMQRSPALTPGGWVGRAADFPAPEVSSTEPGFNAGKVV